jgi:hypothetical protein
MDTTTWSETRRRTSPVSARFVETRPAVHSSGGWAPSDGVHDAFDFGNRAVHIYNPYHLFGAWRDEVSGAAQHADVRSFDRFGSMGGVEAKYMATGWLLDNHSRAGVTLFAQTFETGTLTATRGAFARSDNVPRLAMDLLMRRAEVASWAADDGEPPTRAAFDDAQDFLTFLHTVPRKPSIYASGDAEVGYNWAWQDGFVEVAFRGDGNIRYALRFGGDLKGDVTPFRDGGVPIVPPELYSALQRL